MFFIKFDNAEILQLYLLHGFTCYFQTFSFKKKLEDLNHGECDSWKKFSCAL